MLTELPKVGEKVRYLGGGDYAKDAMLSVGGIYDVIAEDISGDDSDVTIRVSDESDDFWYIYGAKHPCGSDLHKYALVEDSDAVNSPRHYTQGSVEVIDYIDQVADGYEGKQAYYVGNIVKYVSRAPYKNGVEDLRKATWYLNRLIDVMEAGDSE